MTEKKKLNTIEELEKAISKPREEKPEAVAELEKELLELTGRLSELVLNNWEKMGAKEWLQVTERITPPEIDLFPLTFFARVLELAELKGLGLADLAKAMGKKEITLKKKLQCWDLTDKERRQLAELLRTEEGLEIGILFNW